MTTPSSHPLTIACHQPDLLPYSGFWHKMHRADIFVLLPYDQFQKHGYQRRVTMRGHWASHRLVGKPHHIPISEVVVAPGWQAHLVRLVKGRYQGATHWDDRGPDLCRHLLDLPDARTLDAVNGSLIRMMAALLGIRTEIVVAASTTSTGAERVLSHVLTTARSYRPVTPASTEDDLTSITYLSGPGARAYMPDAEPLFADHGVAIEWSAHEPRSPDSILTAYFDESDPMEAVAQ